MSKNKVVATPSPAVATKVKNPATPTVQATAKTKVAKPAEPPATRAK